MKMIMSLICGSLMITAGSFAHAYCFSTDSSYQNFCSGSDETICNIYSAAPQNCRWADDGPPDGGGGYCTSNSGYQSFCSGSDETICNIYSSPPQDCFWVPGR
jgi:hypothetical protein